ncbi:putative amino acid permease C3H1.09c [Termitomyces sp. T112]|nr:putative amino acid permease C3H1.09c [Termitomyces sp. T112]
MRVTTVADDAPDSSSSSSTNDLFDLSAQHGIDTDEETPLLGGQSPDTAAGTASLLEGAFMLFKTFVGTGVLFLGKAFFNGGLLFSIMTLVITAVISGYVLLLLLETKLVVSGSYHDIGGTLYGPRMRSIMLGSIFVSQIGFSAAYFIFVAENLQAFILGITHCTKPIPLNHFILLQFSILIPFALVRDIAKLSPTALLANTFILSGLLYVFGSEISILGSQGVADIKMFNPKDFPLFIGTAVFSFQAIGLFIPITESLREPRRFFSIVKVVVAAVTLVFGVAGSLGYLTFGSKVETVILINLDSSRVSVQIVQLFYALAILLSTPLQFLPSIEILEKWTFGSLSGKPDMRLQENVVRIGLVGVCAAIAWAGKADLGKFVALIGCLFCVPLTYIYPPILHYRACARSRKQKIVDASLVVLGIVVCVYTTAQTVKLMLEPAGGPPKLGNCPAPPT